MYLLGTNPFLSICIGIVGLALIGYVLQHLTEGRKYSEQIRTRKFAIVAPALAQWPYLYLTLAGVTHLIFITQ